MASPLLLTLLCAVTLTAAAPKDTRIVGGQDTTIQNYPWLVAVEFTDIWSPGWAQRCAGNLLTSTWVLSAAHCFDGRGYTIQNRRIRAGSTLRNSGGTVRNINRRHNHPSYNVAADLDGDITVVAMVTPLAFTNEIQPATIIAAGTSIPDNMPVVHVGWGATSSGGNPSTRLQHVTINTVNRNLCAQRYWDGLNHVVTENMICAGLLDVGGADACQGDSGGPLYYGDIVVGIVSGGYDCADPTYPGLSTAVSSYTDWIVATAR